MTFRKNKTGWRYFLIAMPFMLYVIAFYFVPLFGWIYSFYNYNPALSFSQLQFAGFDNFLKIYNEWSEIYRVLKNTLAMSFLSILVTPLPLIAAIMLNEIKHGKFKRFIQTVTTLPNFISWIVVFALTFAVFSNDGLYYTLLRNLHLDVPVIGIMGNNGATWFFQLGLSVWKSIGWTMIIYIAAIAGIDNEQYEAARIDGAGKFGLMRHITIPGLAPTFLVLLLLQISNLLNNGFDQYFVFYNSLVADKIEVLDFYIYKVGWLVSDYSYATVLGMVKSLLGIALLFAVNYLSRKTKGESIL
ncbi:multiple sugar transport system permease protein/putative aldouronate transport system permease protein [Paenibacillus taihuensis]|uniref:Multiple sugar transport system permease protein/putative aldouronate transport system permease protein n=1 Tax=Paenibacillus taihuensis TaxID=1156355 RepID=A0A3D9QVE0_9BACL|nr:ABC transporter permease subunit [Paenibacillus taihuensis]REE68116.1 multiple sugar transport system permease protein/putative aldouronate transport system permease protein [Paenibacillus taihuensis]